jgi:hypothetical protein
MSLSCFLFSVSSFVLVYFGLSRFLFGSSWWGICFDCIPIAEFERDYIWPPGTVSIGETLGLPRLHTCLRCGNKKEFEKTCEACWGPQPQEDDGPIIHQSNGTLEL